MQQPELLKIFLLPLEHGKVDYMVTGSVASTLYGEPRLTHDIDIVLVLAMSDVARFLQFFPLSEFYCPPEEVIRIEIARSYGARFNLIHHESGYKADCYISGGHPLHAWGMKNRKRLALSVDFQVWVAPPEYVIIRKLQFFREGKSEKHLKDIQKMVLMEQTPLSLNTLMPLIREYQLSAEWDLVKALR